ncbi:hypothetical protein GLAREA_04865 [Glarea lozoyensis ATCC 20868]|uniref:Uncharacterized protein n=1 Tax=Glarea lozoyensis (strain ATCC 20868 / MF5171) TaxID=1116229 RepID=S3CSM5_GLAL2|nr:uncharacterized protein GLAREA_04865 [Glarea lozoyensis ATCC 20868]EPE28074.1 hypothetical protein GLAREA_04865 [Glarea lozoyensis ATCC 20868]
MSHEIVTFGSTDREEQGFILLNGEMLYPYGEITLQWTGKSFRRMFVTTFLVISGDKPWQIILGAPTIHEYGIMKVTGLGGMVPLPRKKSAEEHAKDKERKKQHADEVAANNAKVATHKKDKQQDARHASAKKAKDSRSSK